MQKYTLNAQCSTLQHNTVQYTSYVYVIKTIEFTLPDIKDSGHKNSLKFFSLFDDFNSTFQYHFLCFPVVSTTFKKVAHINGCQAVESFHCHLYQIPYWQIPYEDSLPFR